MARSKSTNAVKSRKQKKPSLPRVVKRGNKVVGPSFEGHESWSGQDYHIKRTIARDFFYENYKLTDLLPDVWAWMKENKYSANDIKAAKTHGVGIVVAINCKLLRQGMPDYNKIHAEYWEALTGTGDRLEPVSEFIRRKLAEAINKGYNDLSHPSLVQDDENISKPVIPSKLNIQELMKERTIEAASEIEALYDQFISLNAPKEFDTRKQILAILDERKLLPQHIPIITKPFERIKSEYVELQLGKDQQLIEGYSRFSKVQVKNIIKILDQIIDDINAYVSIKKAAKATTVRARKPVSVEKIVSKIKYLKSYKDESFKLDLTSVSPTKLHSAAECYLYDTAKRKLIYLVADEYSQVLSVKGTTILGFDTKKSVSKNIRKPGDTINQLMKIGRPASRKFVEDIKAVGTIPNGRMNATTVILKAW